MSSDQQMGMLCVKSSIVGHVAFHTVNGEEGFSHADKADMASCA